MHMQVDMDWSSRMAFNNQKSLPTSTTTPRSPLTATVILSNSPIEINILSYHIPCIQTMSIKEEPSRTKRACPASGSSQSIPTVHFPDDDDLVLVFEFDDDLESKEIRSCYWEIFARDRARFKDIIEQASVILNPILEPSHRAKVYSRLQQSLPDEDKADGGSIPVGVNSVPGDKNDLIGGGSGDSCSSGSTNGKKSRRKRRRKCQKRRK